jgi:hypothetical protein
VAASSAQLAAELKPPTTSFGEAQMKLGGGFNKISANSWWP